MLISWVSVICGIVLLSLSAYLFITEWLKSWTVQCEYDRVNAEEYAVERLAQLFHENYERLAPEYGYETRPKSAVAWEEVPEDNRNLMIATAEAIIDVVPGLVELLVNGDAL